MNRRKALHELLAEAYPDPGDLKQFLDHHHYDKAVRSIDMRSVDSAVRTAIRKLASEGQIDDDFFDALAADKPNRSGQVDSLRNAWRSSHFNDWVSIHSWPARVPIGLFVGLAFFAALFFVAPRFWLDHHVLALLTVHLGVTGLLLVLVFKDYETAKEAANKVLDAKTTERGRRVALQATRQFMAWCCGLFLVWVLLYACLFFAELGPSRGFPEEAVVALRIAGDVLNNAQWLVLWIAYLVLSEKTVQGSSIKYWPVLLGFAIFVGVRGAADLIGGAWPILPAAMTGLLNAVTLALLVGRLDSKRLGGPKWVHVSLYLYAAIQPFWFLYGSLAVVGTAAQASLLETFMHAMFALALFLKLLLFLYIHWAYESGRLAYYMYTVRGLLDSDVRDFAAYKQGRAQKVPLQRSRPVYDVFLSAPMSSLASDFALFNGQMQRIAETIREQGLTVYYAGDEKPDAGFFESPKSSLASMRQKLEASRVLLLVYPSTVASSALVEAGYALARGVPSVYLVRALDELPFLLRAAHTDFDGVLFREVAELGDRLSAQSVCEDDWFQGVLSDIRSLTPGPRAARAAS